jgi:Uma2 family endonuclease
METLTLNVPPAVGLTDEQFYQLCVANEEWRLELTARDVETINFSFDEPPTLSGKDVLPGFVLDLTPILNS